ncbi:MAG: UPF0104 family protein [Leptolyngbya sp. SIO4C1]|nr:UPF0104 family protein [Leptolyngbya sp. SIO4C1]
MPAKRLLTLLKPYLRWVIVGGTLFFVAKALKDHWQEVAAIELTAASWACLSTALGLTLLAHIWSGWVWGWILAAFGRPLGGIWSVQVYLQTNIAKYLPGNVLHFYGRIRAVQATGTSASKAILSVVMEPLLMLAAALMLATVGSSSFWLIRLAVLLAVLIGVHPYFFNPTLQKLSQAKAKAQKLAEPAPIAPLSRYPLKPLLGELGFVALRAAGFIVTIAALQPLSWQQLLPLTGGFSIAWLLGLVVPGAPGGVGVFEAAAIALLGPLLPTAVLLSGIAFYRLISTLAEVMGAGLIWLDRPV